MTRIKDYYYMDFPSIMPKKVPILTEYEEAIGAKIKEAYLARDLFFVLEDEKRWLNCSQILQLSKILN